MAARNSMFERLFDSLSSSSCMHSTEDSGESNLRSTHTRFSSASGGGSILALRFAKGFD